MVGAVKKKVGEISDEAEELEAKMEERRYWMLREVVAMVIMKLEALCLICLVSVGNGMRWSCTMNGSIPIWRLPLLGDMDICKGKG
ncbi:hypothetical protein FNV43_RR27228 [Rhamnella rubrinervis]|uniref:Uncharacterized protein n=1 Tax=Rhamnella rubrinervis TaxID=2594499 RepID=A0A8K0DP17_9ROSA|nr:hypothetical protein FNV43_RR27228 [Rhamnella rubrinervis]